jgi:pimeloyl-ACP methyl ester carboxylesterase
MKNLLFHTQQGEGKPVVLLHGFCETNEIWKDFIPVLAQKNKVIALDLGGFGESKNLLPKLENSTTSISMEMLAEQVFETLQELGIRECTLIGHSLGGYVGLAFSKKYPDFLNGLGLFHSTSLADSEEKKHSRDKTIAFVQKVGVEKWIETFVKPLFYSERHPELSSQIKFIEKIAVQTPLKTVIEILKAMKNRPDQTEVLKNANFPVLYIIGKQDTSILFETYKEQSLMPKNVVIHILNETAHIGMLERPEKTLKILQDFLA